MLALEKESVLSKRTTVVLRELTAMESFAADELVGETSSSNASLKTYAVCSIRKIKQGDEKFEDVTALTRVTWDEIVERLTLSEVIKLRNAYVALSNEVAVAHDPKPSPPAKGQDS